jgi:hypothetical protein
MEAMREELNAMKARLAKLSSVVQIFPEEDGSHTSHLVCHSIEVLDEEAPIRRPIIYLGADAQGGRIQINRTGDDFHTSVSLGIHENFGAEIKLTGSDAQPRVILFSEEDHGTLALLGPDNAGGWQRGHGREAAVP